MDASRLPSVLLFVCWPVAGKRAIETWSRSNVAAFPVDYIGLANSRMQFACLVPARKYRHGNKHIMGIVASLRPSQDAFREELQNFTNSCYAWNDLFLTLLTL
jgi:hypothetical protein